MKAIATLVFLSATLSSHASIERLVGEFQGLTNVGAPCTISISRPGEVKIQLTSGSKHLQDTFPGGPILDQLDRRSAIVIAENTTGSEGAVLQRSSVRITLDGDRRVTRVRMDWSETMPFEFGQQENIDCDLLRTN